MMKFNLSDFVQLDTKGLLAVNGGYYCNGSSNTTVYSNPYYTGSSGSGSCSTSTSNNPNGQGPSTTSSNPAEINIKILKFIAEEEPALKLEGTLL